MAQVLYRKWRPQRFEEIIGQEHVTRTLQRALASDRVAHAYLFTGPRGTGKTSTARILAKAVNCTGTSPRPCNICASCQTISENRTVDLIEIDAASNRGIDEIRDLRERVKFAPAQAQYKVYTVDEVHMLTSEAFNALLKTLEEPPGHVIFILATTEPHRIPQTVISRCQRFDFRRLRVSDIIQRLERIAQAEELQVTRPALEMIARHATGSMRDAESLLDQLLVYGREGTLDVAEVQNVLGMRGSEHVAHLADTLIDGDLPAGLRLAQKLVDDGVDLRQFNRELVSYLRDLLFLAVTQDGADLIHVTQEALVDLRARAQRSRVGQLTSWVRRFSELDNDLKMGWYGQLPLELALVEAILPKSERIPSRREDPPRRAETVVPPPRPAPARSQPQTASRQQAPVAAPAEPKPTVVAPPQAVEATAPPVEKQLETESAGGPLDLDRVMKAWPQIVERIRPLDPSVQALLHTSYCLPIGVDGQVVVLGFRYAFHKSKIEETRNRRMVERVLSKRLRGNYGIRCVLNEGPVNSRKRRQAIEREQVQQDPRVKAAANIFNARIVDVQSSGEAE